MNEEIRKIVEGYISEGDYEKALSLLMKFPLDDEQDKALLESCKKEFATSCASAIAEAVKAKNKDKAELILSSYKQLLGEDANTTLYQAIVDGIQEQKVTQEVVTNSELNKPTGLLENCEVEEGLFMKPIMWVSYVIISLVTLIIANACRPSLTLCTTTVAIALSLAIPICFSKNKLFKVFAIVLMLIPVVATISHFKGGIKYSGTSYVPWLYSVVFAIAYFLVTPKKSVIIKSIVSFFLFTLLNPLLQSFNTIEVIEKGWYSDDTYYYFSDSANGLMVFAFIATIVVFVITFTGYKKVLKRICLVTKEIKQLVITYKKVCIIAISTICALFILNAVITTIQEKRQQEEQRLAAIEKARQDSIQAVEDARRAAIERARQDSIREAQIREQARLDSIDYAEHASFVAKYANMGLIITNIRMTRGYKDGQSTKGVDFTIFNPTHKTIKYVIVSAYPVNVFGDRLYYTKTCRGIGPVDSHDYGSWEFDDVFEDPNDVIDDLKVSMQVVYTNGSSKSINVTNATVNDFKSSWFEGR